MTKNLTMMSKLCECDAWAANQSETEGKLKLIFTTKWTNVAGQKVEFYHIDWGRIIRTIKSINIRIALLRLKNFV